MLTSSEPVLQLSYLQNSHLTGSCICREKTLKNHNLLLQFEKKKNYVNLYSTEYIRKLTYCAISQILGFTL